MQTSKELPRYKCHKIVNACKISYIVPGRNDADGPGARLIAVLPYLDAINVSDEFIAKHNPMEGGYYVVYEDGYQSYSPAKAFEEGYTLMNNGD